MTETSQSKLEINATRSVKDKLTAKHVPGWVGGTGVSTFSLLYSQIRLGKR